MDEIRCPICNYKLTDCQSHQSINRWLESEGFELEGCSPVGYDCDYEKVIPHDDICILWVNVSLGDRKVYFYDEYDCGGEISNYTSKIPDELALYYTTLQKADENVSDVDFDFSEMLK